MALPDLVELGRPLNLGEAVELEPGAEAGWTEHHRAPMCPACGQATGPGEEFIGTVVRHLGDDSTGRYVMMEYDPEMGPPEGFAKVAVKAHSLREVCDVYMNRRGAKRLEARGTGVRYVAPVK